MAAKPKDLKGISLPFRKEKGKFPAIDLNSDAVKNDLVTLFNTQIRSRVMRPTFGSLVTSLLFQSTGDLFNLRLERAIRTTILNYAPNVEVTFIQIDTGDTAANATTVTATINYMIKGVPDSVEVDLSV